MMNYASINIIKFFFYSFPFIVFLRSAAINLYSLILVLLFLFLLKKKKIFFQRSDIYILIFFLLIPLVTYFNSNIYKEDFNLFFLKSILYIRFFFVYLLIKSIVRLKIISIKIFSKICLASIVFLSLDLLVQSIFVKTSIDFIAQYIFGIDNTILYHPIHNVSNSFFGDERIATSHIQKFFLFSLLYYIFYKDKFFTFFIIITFLGAFLGLQRMPYIIMMLYFLLLLFFSKFSKKIFLSLILLVIIKIFFIENHKTLNSNFIKTKNQFLETKEEFLMEGKNEITIKNDKNLDKYLDIYEYSIYLINKKIFFGSGLKSFNVNCMNANYYKVCPTHSHNIYFEILSTIGFVGFLFFFIFLYSTLNNFIRSHNLLNFNSYKCIIFLFIILELIPIRSYGSIFSTTNATYFWFLLSLSISLINQKKIT